MTIFNSYAKLPEGTPSTKDPCHWICIMISPWMSPSWVPEISAACVERSSASSEAGTFSFAGGSRAENVHHRSGGKKPPHPCNVHPPSYIGLYSPQ